MISWYDPMGKWNKEVETIVCREYNSRYTLHVYMKYGVYLLKQSGFISRRPWLKKE